MLVATASCSSDGAGGLATPFASNSPWRQQIPAGPELRPNSAEMIAGVQQRPALVANLVEYGIPIYKVTSQTPVYSVACSEDWGVCPFAGWPVPVPDGGAPHKGTDGAMVTVNESTGIIYEFWRATRKENTWTTAWGAVNSLNGSGWGGASTGSAASRLGGVIRVAEIAAGEIPHALALQTQNACTSFQPPALKSDGTSARSDCLPEGSRLQLDPSLDLSKLGLSRGEMAVAKAMQIYGGYIMDVSQAPLSVSFELDTGAAPGTLGKTYKDAGFRWDYDAMERVPWGKLRVLT
ncbi:hypothetical protein BayCH28_06055 [Mycolicibacterium sp. CH28]|nr:hypothetical protein BayCH28_06055 [Mycolicibacterium sp. CH28]